MLLKRFFKPRIDPTSPLYEAIVAAARQKQFYAALGVPDTIDGRFDMLVLHMWLVLARLKGEHNELRQALIDRFCVDMDDNLREIGASDITVGKKVRRMAEAFQGRYHAYETASDEQQLEEALARNIYAGKPATGIAALAHYVTAAKAKLAGQASDRIAKGELEFS